MTDTTAGEGERYVGGRLDMKHAPSLGRYIAKSLASEVSGNRQPCMSGDNRDRLHEHVRHRFDRTCETVASEILKALAAQPSAGAQGEAVAGSLPWLRGLLEQKLEVACRADHADALFPMDERQAAAYHQTRADLLGWVLDMLPSDSPPLVRIEATPAQPDTRVALSASDRACYDYPGVDQCPLRDAFVAGAEAYAQPDTGDVAALREALRQIVDEIDFSGDPEDRTLAVIDGLSRAALSKPNAPGAA